MNYLKHILFAFIGGWCLYSFCNGLSDNARHIMTMITYAFISVWMLSESLPALWCMIWSGGEPQATTQKKTLLEVEISNSKDVDVCCTPVKEHRLENVKPKTRVKPRRRTSTRTRSR